MVLFMILATILTLLLMFTVAVVSIGGAVGIVLFSDVIVCIGIILLIMKKIIKKKK